MIQIQTECMLLVDIVCLGIIVFLLERGTAMYRQTPFLSSYPCCISGRGIEITVLRAAILPDVTIVVQVRQLHNLNYGNSGTLFFLFVWFFFFFFLGGGVGEGRLLRLTTGAQLITSTLIYHGQKLQ